MFNREDFEFSYFFNAGLDTRSCQCDVEGTDVMDKDGNYLGSINWVTPADISEMDDDELEQWMFENEII